MLTACDADKRVPVLQRSGFVRRETVIAKGRLHERFYCGACQRSWIVGGAFAGRWPPETLRSLLKQKVRDSSQRDVRRERWTLPVLTTRVRGARRRSDRAGRRAPRAS
jgi:hypothetical protein